MANAVMVGTNFYRVVTNNPVSAQPVIDAGIAYVRSHPNAESAAEIYQVLADAYEERGLFDKAISYHELAGSPKEKIAALEEKSAKALLNAASKSGSRGAREYYLTSVIDRHPDTPAAAEATKKLAELAKEENQGMRMSKQFLLEHPEIYGPRGLGLKASLFDGKPQNMEIADRGINLVNDNEMLVYFQTPWGVRGQTYPLPKTVTERFFVTLREKNLQVALSDVNAARRAKSAASSMTRLLRSFVRPGRAAAIRESWTRKCSATTSAIRAANTNCRRSPAASRRAASA
jgi:tetratricopeptide (TPR) repeat protein